jgi:carboxymethylenebutenolidase
MRNRTALVFALALVPAAGLAQTGDAGHDAHAARMEKEHRHDSSQASPAAEVAPRRPVEAEEVVYARLDGKEIRGYVARPEGAAGPLPGLLVIQEWWGLNDHIRAMARRFAGEGYVALAVDLYEGEVATTPEAAGATMRIKMARPERLVDNLKQAHAWLAGEAKAPRVGVVGWCFGGGWALETALQLRDGIDAAVMYYGRTTADPAELARLEAPLLGHFGEADEGIPLDGVRAMESALKKLGKPVEIVVYPGAGHAFANPTGERYQAAAAEESWRRTTEFLARHLRPAG